MFEAIDRHHRGSLSRSSNLPELYTRVGFAPVRSLPYVHEHMRLLFA